MTNPDKILKEVTFILKQFGVEKIILFGSYAYGTPNEFSDIDLLVIKNIPANETRNFRITLKKALWVKLGKLDYSFDIIVDNEKRIQERINLGDLFYKEIYTKGKTIYAITLGNPGPNQKILFKSFAPKRVPNKIGIKKITLLGSDEKIGYELNDEGLWVKTPGKMADDMAFVFRIETK